MDLWESTEGYCACDISDMNNQTLHNTHGSTNRWGKSNEILWISYSINLCCTAHTQQTEKLASCFYPNTTPQITYVWNYHWVSILKQTQSCLSNIIIINHNYFRLTVNSVDMFKLMIKRMTTLTSLAASTSAPACMRSFIASTWPPCAAANSGVALSYMR